MESQSVVMDRVLDEHLGDVGSNPWSAMETHEGGSGKSLIRLLIHLQNPTNVTKNWEWLDSI